MLHSAGRELAAGMAVIVNFHNCMVNGLLMIAIDDFRCGWNNLAQTSRREIGLAIYTIAQYKVRREGVEKVKRAIAEFVPFVKANEPGTRLYLAWQQKDDPTRFVHFFIFDDEAAHKAHSQSAAVRRFEEAYRPELDVGDVMFTDYNLIATNQD